MWSLIATPGSAAPPISRRVGRSEQLTEALRVGFIAFGGRCGARRRVIVGGGPRLFVLFCGRGRPGGAVLGLASGRVGGGGCRRRPLVGGIVGPVTLIGGSAARSIAAGRLVARLRLPVGSCSVVRSRRVRCVPARLVAARRLPCRALVGRRLIGGHVAGRGRGSERRGRRRTTQLGSRCGAERLRVLDQSPQDLDRLAHPGPFGPQVPLQDHRVAPHRFAGRLEFPDLGDQTPVRLLAGLRVCRFGGLTIAARLVVRLFQDLPGLFVSFPDRGVGRALRQHERATEFLVERVVTTDDRNRSRRWSLGDGTRSGFLGPFGDVGRGNADRRLLGLPSDPRRVALGRGRRAARLDLGQAGFGAPRPGHRLGEL